MGSRARWSAAVVAGDTACTSTFGEALEAVRMKQFVNNAGQSAFGTLCTGELVSGFRTAADRLIDAACN